MLNNPDLQPNATLNRWIQGILLFDFELQHVPADKHRGPDALSRRQPTPEEREQAQELEQWLDDTTFFTTILPETTHIRDLPSYQAKSDSQEEVLMHIRHFLETLETPSFPTIQA
ncbi:hypothetical protein L227DRAFT_515414, partial [Lentinus tigrinus ALCF2SS1-6]